MPAPACHRPWRARHADAGGGAATVTVSSPVWMLWGGTALAAAAMIYTIAAVFAVRWRQRRAPLARVDHTPAVTVLKPLCGDEHELYECLHSFVEQDYPHFQIVFGVSDGDDPAVAVVRRLQGEFPAHDLQLAIDRRQHGSSRKVSNLINMMALARHEYLVISDSDVRVTRDYLAQVVGPLHDAEVGIVTCAYRGNPRPGLWSLMGSLFINDWFMPSVSVAAVSGSRAFAFGSTIALRSSVLERIGGFAAIANQLADDYRLGELTRGLGLRTVLSDLVVETCVDERSFVGMVRHELRWLRTIRAVRPVGYSMSFVTFGLPVAGVGSLLTAGTSLAVTMLGITTLARIMLHWTVRRPGAALAHVALLPLRDGLSLILWGWSFVNRHVHWRDHRFQVTRDGSVQPVVRISS
jgi:ceramide glucosyltransferase